MVSGCVPARRTHGADSCELRRGGEAERVLAGLGVGDGVCHRTACAGPRDVGQRVFQVRALGGSFEAPVFVEQSNVDVEDSITHDSEAKVA